MFKTVLALVLLLLGSSTAYSVDTYDAEKFNIVCINDKCAQISGVYHVLQDGVDVMLKIITTDQPDPVEVVEEVVKKHPVSYPVQKKRGRSLSF